MNGYSEQRKVAGRTAYDPYGNITYQTGTQPIMTYAGLYKHDASDLYLATFRAYSPATARWINRDPIREAGGLNIYAYVGGDPVSKLDPLGLDWIFSYSEGSLVRVDENNKSIDKPFKGVYAGAPGYKNDSES